MRNDLEQLLRLQVIDYDLGELERSKDYLPDMMENLRNEIADAKKRLSENMSQLEEATISHKSHELEIKTKEAELQKFQQQMMSIKTNKEYDALVAEIDNRKKSISEHENQLLEVMERLDALGNDIDGLKEKEKQVVENNQKQLEILQEKIDSIGEKVSSKETSRQAVVAGIPKPTLSTYERIRRGRGGRAVVSVKKNACSACFKSLTPRKIQEIRRVDKVQTCDNCGCLLFWNEEQTR